MPQSQTHTTEPALGLTVFVPHDATAAWTMVLALGTVAVAIAAFRGLRSLKLARTEMVTRATREARAMAIDRGEQFVRLLNGELKAVRDKLGAANIPAFTINIASGAAIFDNPAMYAAAKLWWDKVPFDAKNETIAFLNAIEAWAMYFTQALAEDDVVFAPCAPTYCSIVMQYAAWVIIARKEQSAGYYSNLVKLFNAWRSKLDAQDGGEKTEAALRAAHAAQERMAKHKLPATLGKDPKV